MDDMERMETRREIALLKAQVAELGRRIEDQADAAESPMRVEAGSGVEVREVGDAYRVSTASAAAAADFPYGGRWAFGIEFFEAVVDEETLPHARIHNVVTRTGQIYAEGGPLEALLGADFSGMLFLVVNWDDYPDGAGLFTLQAVAEDPAEPGAVDPVEVAALLSPVQELVPLYWIEGGDFTRDFIHGAHSGHGWMPTDFDEPEEA